MKVYEADLETDFSYDDRNANKGTPRGRGMLEKSIGKLGAGRSLVADKNGKIVAGNKTREALTGAKMKRAIVVETDGTTPVIVKRTDWDLDERNGPAREYAYADNRIAEMDLDWDLSVIAEDVAAGADLSVAFSEDDLHDLLGTETETKDVEPTEPPENPVAKTGDVWILGRHRLVCGDSTDPDVVALAMDGTKASCIFTDPPYGVSIAAKNKMLNQANGGRSCELVVVDDDLSPSELKERLLPAFVNIREIAMADDCTLFVCAPQRGELGMMMMMMMMMTDAGLRPRHVLIWKKNCPTFSMGRLDYDYQHEPILLTWGARHKRPMRGSHKTSIWEVDKPRESKAHPTMKPVELYINAYLNNSDRDDHVFEPYSGSGTAFLAAEQTGRTCHGIEISPAFVDVAISRWETLTAGKATRL